MLGDWKWEGGRPKRYRDRWQIGQEDVFSTSYGRT